MVLKRIIPGILIIVLNTIFGYGQVQLEPVCNQSIEIYGVDGLPGSEFIWTVRGGTVIAGDGTPTVTIHWGNAPGDYSIEVMERTMAGCFNVPSEAKIAVRGPVVNLGFDEPEICYGDTLEFDVGTGYQEPYTITWQDNSNQQFYQAYQSEEIRVTVIDGFNCSGHDTVHLIVNNLPVINIADDTVLCSQDEPLMLYGSRIIDNQSNFDRVVWILDGDDTYNDYITIYPSIGVIDTLLITIYDLNNCKQNDTMLVMPCNIADIFKEMPNTITPGAGTEGENDVWNIPYMDLFPDAVLEIFDRWGRLVYHTEHVFEEPWDGKSKGRLLPMDSYYFVLKLNFANADPITGTVNLIK